jgi:serine/threonine protein kinase
LTRVQEFGGWLPGEEIHSNANAKVYRATRGEASAVLKVCATSKSEKPSYRRFVREIEALRELDDDPGVMPIIDFEIPDPPERGRFPWYVMPEGLTFYEAVGGSPVVEVVTAVSSAAATLSRLHQRDYHHRDVKPANLFELADGGFVVGDLGLVGRPAGVEPGVTQSGEKLGPANFIAPEMLQVDVEKVDARFADVYSLAKTLWALCSGHDFPLPGPQRADDPSSLAAQTGNGPVAELDGLIERATANEPESRPSMNEMASELDFWLQRQGAAPEGEASDLDRIVATARARLSIQHGQQASVERYVDAAEEAFGSVLDRLDPIYAAMEKVGATSNLNDSDPLIASALHWSDRETVGRPRIVDKWESLAYAQVGERNAVRLHLAVRLLLYEGGQVSVGVGIDVTGWPMAAGRIRFHWREVKSDIPVQSIQLKHQIDELAESALAKSVEAIDTFSSIGQGLG